MDSSNWRPWFIAGPGVSQLRYREDAVTGTLTISCPGCGASVSASFVPGTVQEGSLNHKAACALLARIERATRNIRDRR